MSKKFTVRGLTTIREDWGEDADDFCVQVHCELGSDRPGGEAFVVTVVSPRALAAGLKDPQTVDWGRGCLFMRDYSAPAVQAELQRFIDGSRAQSWDELAEYVGKYFDWI